MVNLHSFVMPILGKVYSTCSLNPFENEAVVAQCLSNYAKFAVEFFSTGLLL